MFKKMVRVSKIQLCLGFFILTICLTNGLSLEEQIELLVSEKYAARNAKVTTELRSQVTELKGKVEKLELLLTTLQNERPDNVHHIEDHQSNGRSTVMRTCRELRTADPSLPSGDYWIDPDGQAVGDDPIKVYCNMATGSTSIHHDSEATVDVGHCADPGCYSRPINYNSTKRQIAALSELSNECHQSIYYDCVCAPLEINGITYSWWNDQNGNPQYFWSGDNSSVHTCQCGIDHNCVETLVPCNCDSSLPTLLSDHGVITDKNVLPITRLNFGRTILDISSGFHTLGKYECTGQKTIIGTPKSCIDLWLIGHYLSGIYSVMGSKQIETVYCDFTKLSTDPGFQTWIGYADVKSMPIYFYVQKNRTFNSTNTPIPFEVERLNIGEAMNLKSGIFTVPRNGKYFFALSAIGHHITTAYGEMDIGLMLNGNQVGRGETNSQSTAGNWESFSLQSILDLKVGDQVWLEIHVLLNSYLEDDANHFTHFNGWLLQEDIAQSLPSLNTIQ